MKNIFLLIVFPFIVPEDAFNIIELCHDSYTCLISEVNTEIPFGLLSRDFDHPILSAEGNPALNRTGNTLAQIPNVNHVSKMSVIPLSLGPGCPPPRDLSNINAVRGNKTFRAKYLGGYKN
jgi:hypothetical protein